jgi:hypothetical protein
MGASLCKLHDIRAEIDQDLSDLKKQKQRVLSRSNSSSGSLDKEELDSLTKQISIVQKSLGTVDKCIENYEETLTF